MIKALLLCIASLFISSSASAQWWKRNHQPERLPLLQINTNTINFDALNRIAPVVLKPTVKFEPSRYSYDLQEAAIMKELYHTLRFHMQPEIITGFNRLVALYIQEGRYSEAKWYLLQCIYFGRKNNNNTVVSTALVSLAMLKADIGEYEQARENLLEAQTICASQGRQADVLDINQKLKLVEAKRFANVKNDIHYADVIEAKKG